MPPRKTPPACGHVLSERFADQDLVDRIFDYVLELMPDLAERSPEVKAAIREEFGAEKQWVRTARHERRRHLASEVLRLFNGRNASEVARRLGISRAGVYRYLKQSGR